MKRTGPPRRLRALTVYLAILGIVLLATTGLVIRITSGAGRNLGALVVTPAPAPARPQPADGAILVLPTLAAGPPSTPAPADPNAPLTILLLGSDRRPGEEAIPRTDAMILVRVEPAAGRVAMLSLPRDLWVAIPGHGENRISNAYLWGERDGPPGAGLALARATVGDLTGLPIDYVAVIDFAGFAALVDAIGGVTVTVERELVDTQFPTADYRTATIRFRPGTQRMDGITALAYSRIRHPDSDFARGLRQQQVLLAIGERLRERGYLANLLAAEDVTAALVGYVQTDMPEKRMVELAWALRDLDLADVERYALTEQDVTFGVDNDRFAQQLRPGAIERAAGLLQGK